MKNLLLLGVFSLLTAGLAHGFSDRIDATYEVPVPAEWKAYATFAMKDFRRKDSRERIRVTYTLPREITGVENKVEFEGDADYDSGHLTGPNGEMNCEREDGGIVCRVKYHGVIQDLGAVESYLDSLGLSPEEKAIRLEVAKFVVREPEMLRAFAGGGADMEGVIRY